MLLSIGRYRRVFFMFLSFAYQQLVKKRPFLSMEYCGSVDELLIHLICCDSSYCSNAYVVFYRIGVCCNSPLLGRKGVKK